jgi:ABC-type transport system involved in cytochrome c biogenesis permease subunit
MLGLLAAVVMIYNLHTVFIKLPDEVMQGAVYRIMFIHVPAASVAHLLLHRAGLRRSFPENGEVSLRRDFCCLC